MARRQQAKELFTASEVARFCQVDLKTIHNWSDRGEIRHFRTPGRHLRFPAETPMANLLVSMLDRMGVQDSFFGDSTGALRGLEG